MHPITFAPWKLILKMGVVLCHSNIESIDLECMIILVNTPLAPLKMRYKLICYGTIPTLCSWHLHLMVWYTKNNKNVVIYWQMTTQQLLLYKYDLIDCPKSRRLVWTFSKFACIYEIIKIVHSHSNTVDLCYESFPATVIPYYKTLIMMQKLFLHHYCFNFWLYA